MEKQILREFWRKYFKLDWKLGVFLIILFGIPRFILVLHANSSGGGYGYVSLIFILMWFMPLILLTKDGRRQIGIRKPKSWIGLFSSFFFGVAFCGIVYLVFHFLYSNSINNSFVYIAGANAAPQEFLDANRLTFFITYSIVSMTFSPIGEELFYRGVVHQCFVSRFGENKASIFDSMAFAITHLAHFGIVYYLGAWTFLPIPAMLWMASMFLASQVFFRCKQLSGSIYGAILSHAAYNFAMGYFIFYQVL